MEMLEIFHLGKHRDTPSKSLPMAISAGSNRARFGHAAQTAFIG